MGFAVTIYYTDKPPEYIYNASTIDVLSNGFFRIVDEDQTYIINPTTVERMEASKLDE